MQPQGLLGVRQGRGDVVLGREDVAAVLQRRREPGEVIQPAEDLDRLRVVLAGRRRPVPPDLEATEARQRHPHTGVEADVARDGQGLLQPLRGGIALLHVGKGDEVDDDVALPSGAPLRRQCALDELPACGEVALAHEHHAEVRVVARETLVVGILTDPDRLSVAGTRGVEVTALEA